MSQQIECKIAMCVFSALIPVIGCAGVYLVARGAWMLWEMVR